MKLVKCKPCKGTGVHQGITCKDCRGEGHVLAKKPGPQKGVRHGGRAVGTQNKRTGLRTMLRQIMETPEGKSLIGEAVKNDLLPATRSERTMIEMGEQLAESLFGIVTKYNNRVVDLSRDQLPATAGELSDAERKLEKFVRMTMLVVSTIAPYRFPTFKAIVMREIPPPPADTGEVIDLMREGGDQSSAAATYMRMVRADPKVA